MSYIAPLAVLIATFILIDSARKKGAFSRPEFYLLITLYLYSTFGYLAHLYYSPDSFIFMIPVDDSTIHTSYVYSVVAILAVYLGGALYSPAELRARTLNDDTLFVLALGGCLVALAVNFYSFYTAGFLSGGFDRVTYIDEVRSSVGFNFPHRILWMASLSILALHERRPLAWTSWFVFACFALLHLPIGDRRVILSALIVILTAKLLRGARFRIRTLSIVLTGVLVLGVGVEVVEAWANSGVPRLDTDKIFLSLSEFARPFVTLLYYVDHGYTLLYGGSYFGALMNAIPGFISPFDKPLALGQQFRQVIGETGIWPGRVSGYGFFPVTEAMLNFGAVGIPMLFLLLSVLVRKLSSFAASRSELCFLVPLLCSAVFSFGRSTFQDVFTTYLWVFVFGLTLYALAMLIEELKKKWKKFQSLSQH